MGRAVMITGAAGLIGSILRERWRVAMTSVDAVVHLGGVRRIVFGEALARYYADD